ncbi:MAG: hypothetical protein A2451_00400 [Bdellovibrionales bacterium RIFOXYC2_FULL_39_8]|nr:MAG: hypothetical protein A2451_00400 [Bdellovibrionales bacterium RIFOXYC2_FULL_39_8]
MKVDAALLINDYGYSFSCRSCTDIHGEMTGAASTGSAFLATMVDKDGDAIFSITDWFDKTDGKAAMVSNIVNPLSHDALFRAHGVKMAQVWAAALNKKIEKANN